MLAEAQWDEKIRSLVQDAVPRKYRNVALTDDTALQRELGIDSVAVIAMVFKFEEAFGVDLRQLDLQVDFSRLRTVGELVQAGRGILEQARTAGSV